jgi:hypothetical protein
LLFPRWLGVAELNERFSVFPMGAAFEPMFENFVTVATAAS